MRGCLIAQLNVLGRLVGDTSEISTPEELEAWVHARFNGLLGTLRKEWYEGWTVERSELLDGEGAGEAGGQVGAAAGATRDQAQEGRQRDGEERELRVKPEYSAKAYQAWLHS